MRQSGADVTEHKYFSLLSYSFVHSCTFSRLIAVFTRRLIQQASTVLRAFVEADDLAQVYMSSHAPVFPPYFLSRSNKNCTNPACFRQIKTIFVHICPQAPKVTIPMYLQVKHNLSLQSLHLALNHAINNNLDSYFDNNTNINRNIKICSN